MQAETKMPSFFQPVSQNKRLELNYAFLDEQLGQLARNVLFDQVCLNFTEANTVPLDEAVAKKLINKLWRYVAPEGYLSIKGPAKELLLRSPFYTALSAYFDTLQSSLDETSATRTISCERPKVQYRPSISFCVVL